MIRSVDELYDEISQMLSNSGFEESLYALCKYEECIGIFFDDKEAVDYFKGDFDHSGLSQDCVFEYKKVRDKHVAYIYSW